MKMPSGQKYKIIGYFTLCSTKSLHLKNESAMSNTTKTLLQQLISLPPDTLITAGSLVPIMREINETSNQVDEIEPSDGNLSVTTLTASGAIAGDSLAGTTGAITTLTSTTVNATTITTNVAAANLTLSGTTIQAAGTDANVGVKIAGKGTGSVIFSINGSDVWRLNGSATLVPETDATYDIGNTLVNPRDITASRSLINKGIAAIGYGQLAYTSITSARTFVGGATETIPIQIPAGAKLLGVSLRVDVLIVAGGGGVSWSAAYSGGSTQAIAAAQALTKNTKVNTMYDTNTDSDVLSAATDIVITPNAGTLDSGAITAVAYYIVPTSLTDAP